MLDFPRSGHIINLLTCMFHKLSMETFFTRNVIKSTYVYTCIYSAQCVSLGLHVHACQMTRPQKFNNISTTCAYVNNYYSRFLQWHVWQNVN